MIAQTMIEIRRPSVLTKASTDSENGNNLLPERTGREQKLVERREHTRTGLKSVDEGAPSFW